MDVDQTNKYCLVTERDGCINLIHLRYIMQEGLCQKLHHPTASETVVMQQTV